METRGCLLHVELSERGRARRRLSLIANADVRSRSRNLKLPAVFAWRERRVAFLSNCKLLRETGKQRGKFGVRRRVWNLGR